MNFDLNTDLHATRYIAGDTPEEIFAQALDLAPDDGEPWMQSLNVQVHWNAETEKIQYVGYLLYGGF